MVVADVNVSAQRLNLTELPRGDGHALHSAADEEEIHGAPTLYKDTVS